VLSERDKMMGSDLPDSADATVSNDTDEFALTGLSCFISATCGDAPGFWYVTPLWSWERS
jgi:hypothetical protein